jgi:hypothetical protein
MSAVFRLDRMVITEHAADDVTGSGKWLGPMMRCACRAEWTSKAIAN